MVYIVIAVIALYAASEISHRLERAKLLNRLMARDYGQFKYFEDKWKPDLKAVEEARAAEVKASSTEKKQDLSQFEDDWEEENG